MPTGLWPARGVDDAEIRQGKPASAFSKGDLLQYNSNSSLSGLDMLQGNGVDIAGIALADSNDSFRDHVPYLKPNADTVFWSVATAGSAFTPGFEGDFDVDGDGRPVATDSVNTVRWVAEELQADLPDQSVQSRALIRLLMHAGNVEHS